MTESDTQAEEHDQGDAELQDQTSRQADAAVHVAGFFGLRIIRMPLSFVTSIMLARALGVHTLGIYSALLIIGTVFQPIFRLGIPTGINYYLRKGDYRTNDVLWTCVAMGFVPGALTSLLVYGLWQASWLGATAALAPDLAFYIVILTMPLMGIHAILVAVLYSEDRFGAVNLIALISSIAQSLALLVLFLTGDLGLLAAVFINACVTVVQLSAVCWTLSKTVDARLGWNSSFASECLRFGVKAWPSGIFMKLSLRLDHLILAFVGSAESLGLYALAVSWNERLMFLPDSLAPVVYNKVCASEDKTQSLAFVSRIHRVAVFGVLLLGAALSAAGVWFIPWVYGPEFAGSVLLISLLVPGTAAFASMKILSKLSTGSGYPGLGTKAAALGAVVGAAAYYWMVPKWFDLGAAVGSTICYSVMAVALIWMIVATFKNKNLRLLIPDESDVAWTVSQLKSVWKRFHGKR